MKMYYITRRDKAGADHVAAIVTCAYMEYEEGAVKRAVFYDSFDHMVLIVINPPLYRVEEVL
jgi:hypothetical protein